MDEDRKITKEELKKYVKDHILGLKSSLHDEMGVMHYIAHFFSAQMYLHYVDDDFDDIIDYFMEQDVKTYYYDKKKKLEVYLELIDRFEKYANS